MTNQEAVEWVKEQIYGWVGNCMRDLDARGIEITTDEVATALEQVAYMVSQEPTADDFTSLLDPQEDE